MVKKKENELKVSVYVNLRDLVTISQAAEILDATRQAVHGAFQRGRITGYQIGEVILLDRRSVEQYKQTRHPGGLKKKKKK